MLRSSVETETTKLSGFASLAAASPLAPNVKDEPRRERARLVLHSRLLRLLHSDLGAVARGVTDPGVGSGDWFGD